MSSQLSTIHDPVALYVHVPFCRSRCAYCDFNTYAGLETLTPAYARAVRQEIKAFGKRWGRLSIPTVYFGGGTPSLLSLELLSHILEATRSSFHVAHDAEITLEANPGTVTMAYLRGIRDLGINRLSLGVQSAHDHELRLLGRIHTRSQAWETVRSARAAGFENLNLDLIFGLPGQDLAHWRQSLETILGNGLRPEHLSLYALTIEQGTPLHSSVTRGELPTPDEDTAAEMYELAEKLLAGAGFFHYEISNWAQAKNRRPTTDDESEDWWPRPPMTDPAPTTRSEDISPYVCQHNLTYWRNRPWLGVGAGAYSWLNGRRWANVHHPQEYIAAMGQSKAPVTTVETIDRQTEIGETMMLGLRLAEGIRDAHFRAQFGVGLEEAFGVELDELQDAGLLKWNGYVARLTARGRLLGNRVFARFV